MDFCDIELDLLGKKLKATVLCEMSDGREFYFYLLDRGRVISRSDHWQKNNNSEWDLKDSGFYSVQYHIKENGTNKHYFSDVKTYINIDDLQEYNKFIEEGVTAEDNEKNSLTFYKNERGPYSDWCYVYSINDKYDVDIQCEGFEQKKYVKGEEVLTAIFDPNYSEVKEKSLKTFSGMVFNDEKFIIAGDGFDYKVVSHLENNIGQYSFVEFNAENFEIKVQNDFFGICKSYYFKKDDLIVISNRYHLILDVLKKINVELEFNKEKVLSNFLFLELQPMHQNFSEEMDVKNIFVLDVNKNINIKNGVFSAPFSQLSVSFSENTPLSKVEYERKLQDAKNEIVSNIKAISENNHFDNIIMDLSGGMDSRLVFSGVTNVEGIKNRIKINSHYVRTEPKDLDIALSLNQLYQYDYCDIGHIETIPDNKEFIVNDLISYNLGNYYSYTPISYKNKLEKSIRMNGFYGEVCARPYYSRKFLNEEDVFELDADEFSQYYFNKHRHLSIGGSGPSPLKTMVNIFSKQLEKIPGKSGIQKFDNHYIYFRNGLHCFDYLRSDYACPSIGPLMSKALFEIKNSMYEVHKSIKVELDILKIMNPVIASHIYQRDQDNVEKSRIEAEQGLTKVDSYLDSIKAPFFPNKEAWEIAQEKYRVNTKRLDYSDLDSKAYLDEVINLKESSIELFKNNLKALLAENVLSPTGIGRDVWLFSHLSLDGSKSIKPTTWYLFNKVNSIYYQMKIINK